MGLHEDADALAYSRGDVPLPPSFAMPLGGAFETFTCGALGGVI